MIGKVLQNNNFKATTRYVLEKEKARLLGGTVVGSDTKTIVHEFLMSRDLNPAIERPVYHLIDSYSYDDAATKDLDDAFQLARAIDHFAGLVVSAHEPALLRQADKTPFQQQVAAFIETELYEYQWFCATHEDTKHRHTHLVASRINLLDGRCIPTWQDKERSHRICRELEKAYGLQPLQSFYELERRSPTRGQLEEWEKTGIPPVMVLMQEAIDQEATPGRSLDQVMAALQEQHGIETSVGLYKGKTGVVFEQADSQGEPVRLSGSQLGRGYTYPALVRRSDKSLDLTPPAVVTPLEQTLEPGPLEWVQQEQAGYAQRLATQLQAIWECARVGRPKLQTATFEDYQIRVGEEGQPSLYRGDRLVLGSANGHVQAHGLTEQACSIVERWHTLSQQRTQERQQQQLAHQQQQLAQRQQERQQQLARQTWGKEMALMADRVLRVQKLTEHEGKDYRFRKNGDTLTIEAMAGMGGRGLLVTYQYSSDTITMSDRCTEADRDYFQQQKAALEAAEALKPKEGLGGLGR